jgi:hypothetical protein
VNFADALNLYIYSAVYDLMYNGLVLFHMKLAGVLIVCVGFVLVMFPENWALIVASVVRSAITLIPHSFLLGEIKGSQA